MACLVTSSEIYTQGTSAPDQILTSSDISSHACLTGHLGQIGNFSPDQGIRFGTLEFVADSRGELVLVEPLTPTEQPADPDASTPRTSGLTSNDEVVIPRPSGPPNPVVVTGSTMVKQVPGPLSCDSRTTMPHTDPTRFSDTHPTIASFLNELFDRMESMRMADD